MLAINLNVGDIVYRYENNAAVEQRVKAIIFHCSTRYPEVTLRLLSAYTHEVKDFTISHSYKKGIFCKLDKWTGVLSDEAVCTYDKANYYIACKKFSGLSNLIGQLFVDCKHGDGGDYDHHIALKRYVWRNNQAVECVQPLYDSQLTEDECGQHYHFCPKVQSLLQGFLTKQSCQDNNNVKIITF